MNILDTLITDRTAEDVEFVRELNAKGYENMLPGEKASWDAGLKGAYDYRDMNRVVGAMEYIDRLMQDAKRGSVYVPTIVPHAEFDGAEWRRWNDKVWVASDFPTPILWAAHLANINRLWAAARRFEAVVLPRYDPAGNGYIKPGTVINAGGLCTVTDSVGLLELRVTAVCPPDVTAGGVAWTVAQTADGWTAALDYTDCPYPDIDGALAALNIFCGADGVADGLFTLGATLRYGYDITAGTCAVRWSSLITWGGARSMARTWGGAKPLTWGRTARGERP